MADELSEVVEDIFEGFDTDVEDEPEAQETEESAEDLDALRKEVKAQTGQRRTRRP